MIPLEFLGLGGDVAACYQLGGGQTCDTILGLLISMRRYGIRDMIQGSNLLLLVTV